MNIAVDCLAPLPGCKRHRDQIPGVGRSGRPPATFWQAFSLRPPSCRRAQLQKARAREIHASLAEHCPPLDGPGRRFRPARPSGAGVPCWRCGLVSRTHRRSRDAALVAGGAALRHDKLVRWAARRRRLAVGKCDSDNGCVSNERTWGSGARPPRFPRSGSAGAMTVVLRVVRAEQGESAAGCLKLRIA